MIRSKISARSYIWWKIIEDDLMKHSQMGESCQTTQNDIIKKIIAPMPNSEALWQRVHYDWLAAYSFLK